MEQFKALETANETTLTTESYKANDTAHATALLLEVLKEGYKANEKNDANDKERVIKAFNAFKSFGSKEVAGASYKEVLTTFKAQKGDEVFKRQAKEVIDVAYNLYTNGTVTKVEFVSYASFKAISNTIRAISHVFDVPKGQTKNANSTHPRVITEGKGDEKTTKTIHLTEAEMLKAFKKELADVFARTLDAMTESDRKRAKEVTVNYNNAIGAFIRRFKKEIGVTLTETGAVIVADTVAKLKKEFEAGIISDEDINNLIVTLTAMRSAKVAEAPTVSEKVS